MKGKAYRTRGNHRCIRNLKTKGKISLGNLRCRLEDNIKKDIFIRWRHLVQYGVPCRAILNTNEIFAPMRGERFLD
jgi:hypothetical protein